MAITSSNTINKLTNQQLSIQISLNGLSFCILQKGSGNITTLKQIEFGRKLNPIELLDELKGLFLSEKALKGHFDHVCIIHDNELSTLVPKPLFKEDALADYLKFNSKILKTDFIAYDDIVLNNSVCVYVPYVNVNNFLYDTFGEFTFKHISTVLIEAVLQLEKNAEITKVYVHVNPNHFELIVVENAKLLYYNSFEYYTKQDFIYYILFTAEQLELNPETFNLVFVGNIDQNDEFYKIAYKYIRHVTFGSRNDQLKMPETSHSKHSNFPLIKNL